MSNLVKFVMRKRVNAAHFDYLCTADHCDLLAKAGPFLAFVGLHPPTVRMWEDAGYEESSVKIEPGRCCGCGSHENLIEGMCWDCQHQHEEHLRQHEIDLDNLSWQAKLNNMENNPDAL